MVVQQTFGERLLEEAGAILMQRDIDYAAIAVKTAIVEKFGRQNDLQALDVRANEKTISIDKGDRVAEGTRDNLLAALRKATSYDNFWEVLTSEGRLAS